MPRYIDADALKQGVGSYSPVKYTYEYGLVITVEDIDSAPTADVVERKKGKWLYLDGLDAFECSVCGRQMVRNIFCYCPWCGSDMRKETEDEEK